MNFTYPTETYISQMDAYETLEKLSFSPEDSREKVIAAIEEKAAKKRRIADIANTMIREYVEAFEKQPEALTAEDAGLLIRFFDSLKIPESSRIRDMGIALRLARILKDFFRKKNDTASYIRYLSETVSMEVKLFGNHTNNFPGPSCTDECMALLSSCHMLDEESRKLLLITVFRLCCSHEKGCSENNLPSPMTTLRTIDGMLGRYMDRDDPAFTQAVVSQGMAYNVLLLFSAYVSWEVQNGRQPDIEAYREIVERYAALLEEDLQNKQAPGYMERPGVASYLLRAEYHLGRISFEELMDQLDRLRETAARADDPMVQASGIAQVTYYCLLYLYRFSGYEEETITALSRKIIEETLPRILEIAREVNNVNFNLYLLLFMSGASFTSKFEEFSQLVLEMTVYSDKALFIHTVMVREMSSVIFDHMIEHTPDFFDGVAGHDTAWIADHKQEMRNLLRDCCMFHDIGKLFMLDIVENSMRRLTDDEFQLIKYHPQGFEDIYERWDNQDERSRCIHDCALTHHLWHIGLGGYPKVQQTKNRPFSDILAITDSLDAATDYLGRPYASEKNMDQMIAEFEAGAGTRYGAEVVKTLKVPEVKEKLQELIVEGRKEIYYRVYASNRVD